MTNFKTLIIANPKSGGGKSKWLGPRLSHLVSQKIPSADIVWTTKPKEATELARRGLKNGYEMIVCGGGDGTLNEIINGFFENGKTIRDDAVLGVLPMGSGGDFLRTMRWKPYLKPGVERLVGKKTMFCDVGHVTYHTVGGSPASHYFINIADVGLAYEMMKRVGEFSKKFGIQIASFQGVARAFLSYKKRYVDIVIDDHHKGSQLVTNIFIANGQSNGGGWRFCPEAKLDDGLFDIVVIGDVSFSSLVQALPSIYRGKPLIHPEVRYYRGRQVRILAAEGDRLGLEADGETLGLIPAELTNLPHRIRLKI